MGSLEVTAPLQDCLGPELYQKVQGCKVLVVGAGGIGCELLKNIVLIGFKDIEVVWMAFWKEAERKLCAGPM